MKNGLVVGGLVLSVAFSGFGCDEMTQQFTETEDDHITEDVAALTSPVTGAVKKPAGWTITPPWASGKTHTILKGYGIDKHVNTDSTTNSNDYYALDFDFALNEAVYPIADGTVVYAGPATGGWVGYGNIVFIEHIVGTAKFHSLYAHLNSVSVNPGPIARDSVIGLAGNTGTNVVHLHLAVYKNARFQNSAGGTGPYGGHAMVPEVLSDCRKNNSTCENLVAGDSLSAACGSACTRCVLNTRTDILPFYQSNGWDTSCGNRDAVVNDWCNIDPAGCIGVKTGSCASVCSDPYPNCACPATDNYCHIPPNTPGCPMTYPGGYCDPNGDMSYSPDGNWDRGYYERAAWCP